MGRFLNLPAAFQRVRGAGRPEWVGATSSSYYLLAACCLLFAACCSLFAICYLLFAITTSTTKNSKNKPLKQYFFKYINYLLKITTFF